MPRLVSSTLGVLSLLIFRVGVAYGTTSVAPGSTTKSEYGCHHGCYDEEDERCLKGISEMGCAEIYGHVEWGEICWCGQETGQGGNKAGGGVTKLYFSVPAFVVLFRESLEVMIVLVILIQFLEKTHAEGGITKDQFKGFKREVYIGAAIGFCGCMVFGVGVLCLASLVYQAFEGDNRRLFEGIMMFITCFVLSYLALSFYKMINSKEGHERKMREKIQESLKATQEARASGNADFAKKYTFFILALTTGFREGMESVVFLIGVVSDVSDLSSLPIPIVTALISSRLVGLCFMKGTNRMRVERFMKCSSLLLLFIAAGFFMGAVHKLQELGDQIFGDNTKKDGDGNAWQNEPVWDWSEHANDMTDRFFVLMRALFGYQDKPTPLEMFAYALYWIVIIIIGVIVVRRVDKRMKEKFGQPDARKVVPGEIVVASATKEDLVPGQATTGPVTDLVVSDVVSTTKEDVVPGQVITGHVTEIAVSEAKVDM